MTIRRSLLLAVPVIAAAALLTPLAADAHSSDTPSGRITLPDTAPLAPVALALARASSPAPPAATVAFQVQLRLRDAATAERLATGVSTPGSGQYGRYLTPREFDSRFAPTRSQVAAVSRFLTSYGVHVTGVPADRKWLTARGTVAQVDRAFQISMRSYRADGAARMSTDRAVSIPASLKSTVLTVTGLGETGGARPGLTGRDDGPPAPTGRAGSDQDHLKTPCSRVWSQKHAKMPVAYGRKSFPTSICGYTPAQMQAAYGMQGAIAGGRDGSGVTVAIVDAYSLPTMEADADRYFAHYGEQGFGDGQYTEILPKSYRLQGPCGEAGWQTEQVLDVESVHGLAPGANVTYVAGRSCSYQGLLAPLDKIVDQHLADLVSNSWGLFNEGTVPTSWLQAYHQVVVQAAAEGIGLYFCDLDNGDTSGQSGSAEPVYPASDPDATGVGGTSLAIGSTGGYDFETGWGNDRAGVAFSGGQPVGYDPPPPGTFYAGTGGGVSTLFPQPKYQKGVVPDSLSRMYGGPRMRVEPDISADADPYTGYKIGYTDPASGAWTVLTYGGTSLATPMVAGMIADASQGRSKPVGFVNPALYSARANALHDVLPTRTPVAIAFTSSNPASLCYTSCLITEDRDTSLTTAPGYDDVTGLGTPNGTAFLKAIGG